jgi:cyclohexa-1,5-dienecarbonyl-CoA hydratase
VSQDAGEHATVHQELLEAGAVLRLVLDRPKGNVLTMDLMRRLGEALDEHRDDRHLKLVMLRGAGGTFSFGASVEEHRKAQAPAMLVAFHALARQIASYPVPVAALVEGRCLGGAFELVLCCHFVFAAKGAVFACPEIRLGVFPPVLAALGPSRLGSATAERLLLTGEDASAEALAPTGFITRVLEDGVDGEAWVLSWYREKFGGLSAFALRQATRAARAGAGVDGMLGERLLPVERRYVELVLESHDGNEGIEAFLARRPPVWTDA